MLERRKHPRYSIAIQVRGWLFDTVGEAQALDAETMNVSREGIQILYYDEEERMQLIQSLVSKHQPVGLEMVLPRTGDRIAATGMVRWYKIGSTDRSLQYLIAGIVLEHIRPEEKMEWERFIEDAARITTREAM